MKNIFRIGMLSIALLLLNGCMFNPFGESKPRKLTYKEQVQNFMQDYKSLQSNKAMAYTKGKNGQYVFGQAFEYSTQEKAKARALKQCEDRRAQLGVEESCELLAVGDKFLKELTFKETK